MEEGEGGTGLGPWGAVHMALGEVRAAGGERDGAPRSRRLAEVDTRACHGGGALAKGDAQARRGGGARAEVDLFVRRDGDAGTMVKMRVPVMVAGGRRSQKRGDGWDGKGKAGLQLQGVEGAGSRKGGATPGRGGGSGDEDAGSVGGSGGVGLPQWRRASGGEHAAQGDALAEESTLVRRRGGAPAEGGRFGAPRRRSAGGGQRAVETARGRRTCWRVAETETGRRPQQEGAAWW